MGKKEELLQALADSRQDFLEAIRGVDPHRPIYPPWEVKQIVDHITGWDESVIASIRAYKEQAEPPTPAIRGIDYFNAQSVAERLEMTYEQSLRECEVTRQTLRELIAGLPDDAFEQRTVAPTGQTSRLFRIIEIFIDHEHEHAESIRSAPQ
jgi:hypothetical protein